MTQAEYDALPAIDPTIFYALTDVEAGGVKIETGSYVGTGTYGKDNPNSLTFPFAPKVVGIVVDADKQLRSGTILVNGQAESSGICLASSGSNAFNLKLTWSDNSVSWYTTNSEAAFQLNDSAYTYHYFAIG